MVDVKQKGITLVDFACVARCNGCLCTTTYAETGSDAEYENLRQAVVQVCSANDPTLGAPLFIPRKHLVVSYSRKALSQTGSGHFSPIAAWDPETESVLVRFDFFIIRCFSAPALLTTSLWACRFPHHEDYGYCAIQISSVLGPTTSPPCRHDAPGP